MTDDRPWLKIYPSGVPANIDADKYSSVLEMTVEVFKKYSSEPAFTCMGKTINFTELDKYSTQFGAYLNSRGLEPGDKIALMMPNLIQYPIALFGALKAGLVIVNTNPLYTPREMLHQFNDSGAKAIIIAENFAKNLESILPKTHIKTIILTSIGEMLGGLKGPFVDFVIRKFKKMVPKYNLPNVVTFKQALKAGKNFSPATFDSNPDDVILLQYTGGTTGVSKGAMLTNKNLIANMLQISSWMGPWTSGQGDVALCPLPLYHIFAFSVNCLALMSNGAHNILVTNPRDIPKLVKTFDKYKVNLTTGVNTLFNALLHNKDFQKLDFSNLKIVIGGGAAVQVAIAEQWQKITGVQLTEGYGMTEASPVVTVNPLGNGARLGCIGLPVPSTDVRIMMEDGTIAPIGERGEIQVKGPQVMKGYHNRPEATTETIIDGGWLKTGDIGIMCEDGFFKVVDRLKDMILVSGFNVFPNEIEDVVAAHPKVLEVAAIGVPSEKSGEMVKIFVVKKDKSLNEKELIDYCRQNLTGYKVPKQVEFIKELPKSNVGKILRRKLRE